jgi:hypothetical protein
MVAPSEVTALGLRGSPLIVRSARVLKRRAQAVLKVEPRDH